MEGVQKIKRLCFKVKTIRAAVYSLSIYGTMVIYQIPERL